MHVMAEALGMAQPGSTPIRAASVKQFEFARSAGSIIMDLIASSLTPRSIVTAAAVRNAIRVAISIGASVNVVRHLAAVSQEAGLELDVIANFEELGRDIPQITQIRPNGDDRIEDFESAGGTRAVQVRLREKLETGVLTITGRRLAAVLQDPIQIDEHIIRSLANPFRQEPGLVILRGNVAPDGAIVKLSAVPEGRREFVGPARVFDDEDAAIRELSIGGIQRGDVIVLRMMGPVGGPGTVFACSFMAALVGAGLGEDVAVVTDGELSGLNRGITIGQVMPEAACGGPLAVIREGELLRIDLMARRIDLLNGEIDERLQDWKPVKRTLKPGWLAIYAEMVQPIKDGAVLGSRH
jgi:dihydroxy-acid dehydratase